MAKPRHPWRLAGLLLAAVTAFGCNVMSLPFFLMTGMDPKHEPKCKLASADKEKEVKVVILTASHLDGRPEFLRADFDLGVMLERHIKIGFANNKERVTVISTAKVEKYKNDHPNWRRMGPAEIGRHFGADYVIDLELNDLNLYELGSGNQLYRGKGEIGLQVVDVNKADDPPKYEETYTPLYPKTRGPIAVSDSNFSQFRQAFLNQCAKELSWRFTAHPTSDDFSCSD